MKPGSSLFEFEQEREPLSFPAGLWPMKDGLFNRLAELIQKDGIR
jgi:hypothetical protein